MTDSILIWGKRGSGKTLSAVGIAQKYLRQGRPVATNIDLFLENLLHPSSKSIAIRLPDHPKASDLNALPLGNPNPRDESRNGLLLLDELATFLNSREWQAKDRADIISWLAQSRKNGWDLCSLAQGPKMIDNQIRENLIEVQGCARRMDKIKVPVIGSLWKYITGEPLRFPRIHVLSLKYGFEKGAPEWDSFWFRGADIQEGYDTLQKISAEFGNQHTYTLLSPWHIKGRYLGVWAMYKKLIAVAMVVGVVIGAGAGYGISKVRPSETPVTTLSEQISADVEVTGVMREDTTIQVILSNGKSAQASATKADFTGERYLVDGTWYRKAK